MGVWMRKIFVPLVLLAVFAQTAVADYQLGDHPRIMINKATLPSLVSKATGGCMLADDYASIKAEADWVVANGQFRNAQNRYLRLNGMICTALVYLVEREMGNDSSSVYAQAVTDLWGDGRTLSNLGTGQFDCYAIAYDWIYDAMSEEQRETSTGTAGWACSTPWRLFCTSGAIPLTRNWISTVTGSAPWMMR